MRHVLCLVPFAMLLGCQSAQREEPVGAVGQSARALGAFLDASASRERAAVPQVLVLDPVVGQLLRASFTVYDHQRRVLLENIANVDTVGYKRRIVDLGVQSISSSDGEQFQLPLVQGTNTLFTPGCLELTGRSLDLAIDGEGFFAITLPDGSTGYTRVGVLQLNADGKVVTSKGNVLLPEITVPTDTLEIAIDPEGRVCGRTAGSPDTSTSFGQITLHRFVNPNGLRNDNGILRPSEASGAPMTGAPGTSGVGLLKQGFLERSNVQIVNELVALQMLEKQHDTLVRTMQQFGMVSP